MFLPQSLTAGNIFNQALNITTQEMVDELNQLGGPFVEFYRRDFDLKHCTGSSSTDAARIAEFFQHFSFSTSEVLIFQYYNSSKMQLFPFKYLC